MLTYIHTMGTCHGTPIIQTTTNGCHKIIHTTPPLYTLEHGGTSTGAHACRLVSVTCRRSTTASRLPVKVPYHGKSGGPRHPSYGDCGRTCGLLWRCGATAPGMTTIPATANGLQRPASNAATTEGGSDTHIAAPPSPFKKIKPVHLHHPSIDTSPDPRLLNITYIRTSSLTQPS